MTVQRYREIYGSKVTDLSDEDIQKRIAITVQIVHGFMRSVIAGKLTLPKGYEHYKRND
jgi:hypothetical protein